MKGERTTKVLLQAGLDVETIGCSSLSAAVSGGRISIWLFVVILYFSFSIVFSSGAWRAMNPPPAAILKRWAQYL